MARKLTANTPDGSVSRRTDANYSHVVVVIDGASSRWVVRKGHGSYIPNPTLGQWVSFSWHGRYDLALNGLDKARRLGYRATIVEVNR